MKTSNQPEAETDEVLEAVREYRTSLQALDAKGAVEEADSLTEEDCEVCQQIGRHLAALGVAVLTAPGADHQEATRKRAVSAAEGILEDISA